MMNRMQCCAVLMIGAVVVGCGRNAEEPAAVSERPAAEGVALREEANREVEILLQDYVREIVHEAGDAKFLFTDGSFDKLIEAESAARGGSLVCIAVQPHADAHTREELAALMTDEEDRLSAKAGGANLLRSWQRSRPERLGVCGIQLGLELWHRQKGADIPVSGVLARSAWTSQTDDVVASGIVRARALAERLLDLYKARGENWPAQLKDGTVADRVIRMQWRLSRLARCRAEIYERLGERGRAADELQMAEELDGHNASVKHLKEVLDRKRNRLAEQVTPRDGLQSALARADFRLARRYAETILADEPDDCDANFAVGMDALTKEDYALAEKSLGKCLEKKSTEPAVWNNLAVLKCRQGRYAEALLYAKKAESLAPDNKDIQDTIHRIEAAGARKSPSL